jgi:antitoxin (DNA-binding transcriptional repressor) of toxin-antitoxin stability system
MTVRITEDELVSDIDSVLARVKNGDEVIVEQDHRAVAVIKTPPGGPGRKLSECIALAKAYENELGYTPVPDPGFAIDVRAAVDSRREPFLPPTWD